MKKIYAVAALAIMFTSCEALDGMLDRYPLDKQTEDTFFESESGLLAFSNTFYTILPGGADLYTEDADNYMQAVQLLEARGARTVPASGSGWSWSALRKINTLLDNVGQCKDQQLREKYSAIARFFRAWFYFEKVKRFGDVPWVDTQLASTDDKVYGARDSRELVMQNVIADLDYAIKYLPTDKSAYTVTKWTALAFKSRVCLFEGTFRKYHGITGFQHDAAWYLTKASEAAKTFMDQSGYAVYNGGNPETNYISLFTNSTVQGSAFEQDVILARNYNLEYGVYHNSNYTYTTKSMGRSGMTRKAVATYLMNDGSRFTDKQDWETMTFQEEAADRDPRLGQTIRIPGYKRLGDSVAVAPDLSLCITGYQPIKYVTEVAKDIYNTSDNDLIIIRTAEVLLNYAEAKAELENLGQGTLVQADIDNSVNKLRARVGMPDMVISEITEADPFLTDPDWGGYQNVTGTNQALILEIRRERSVELNQEGFRYYDLMRWKEGAVLTKPMYGMYFPDLGEYDLDGDGKKDLLLYAGSSMPSNSSTVQLKADSDIVLQNSTFGMIYPFMNSTTAWDENKDYFYPIPTDELNLNRNLVQNPGWAN